MLAPQTIHDAAVRAATAASSPASVLLFGSYAVSGCVGKRKYGGVPHGADKWQGPRRAQQQVNEYWLVRTDLRRRG